MYIRGEGEGEPIVALKREERKRLLDHVDENHTRRVRFTVRTLLHTGLRVAELAHLSESWIEEPSGGVDWDDASRHPLVTVPRHDPCECTYCRTQAAQKADHGDITEDEALAGYWQPKAKASQRKVPVHYEETWDVMTEHLGEYGEVQVTPNALWKRVKRAGEELDFEHELTSHALRHTFATAYAEEGMPLDELKRHMGHKKASTSEIYIDMAGERIAESSARFAPDY